MALPDDETLAEEALKETEDDLQSEGTASPLETVPLESGMDTGQGADDDPALAIGDRRTGDTEKITPDEAKRLLGDEGG